MNKKNAYLILAAVIVILGIIFWGMQQPDSEQIENNSLPASGITYYYGETCPHCIEVSKFLEDNKVAEKVEFDKKEVWENAGNNAEMQQRAEECGLDKASIGVPFLYASGECLIGTPAVIGFFKKEAGIE